MLRGWGHQRLLFLCDVKAPYFPGDEGHHVVIWSPNPMKCNDIHDFFLSEIRSRH